jgi:signal transduction histidine kinase
LFGVAPKASWPLISKDCILMTSYSGSIVTDALPTGSARLASSSSPGATLRLSAELRCLHADAQFGAWFDVDPTTLTGLPLDAGRLPSGLGVALRALAVEALDAGAVRRATLEVPAAAGRRAFIALALPERGDAAAPGVSIALTTMQPQTALDDELTGRARALASLFSRDRVLSIVSHDLRGPLNAIHSWVYVLERKVASTDPGIQRALAGIRTGVEQQVALIEEVIDRVRAQTKGLTLERRPFDLAPLLDDVVGHLARGFAAQREVSIELEAPPRQATLTGDAALVWNALWAALAVAVDASAPGACVTLGTRIEGGVWHGAIGYTLAREMLSNETAPHVFEGFARTDFAAAAEVRRDYALSLPRRVAEAHGGQLDLAPGASGDTVIAIRLPLA